MAAPIARRDPGRSATTARARAGAVRARRHAAPQRALGVPIVAGLGALAAAAGFSVRDEYYWTPDAGIGYALGIVGLGAMTALLLYSVRKRARALRGWGALRHWFSVHMLLGVLGPLAIFFHANFRVESVNAGVALAAMILVAGSGFVGRFVYTRVHHGLFGHRETLRELAERAASSRGALAPLLAASPALATCVRDYEAVALAAAPGLLAGARRTLWLSLRTRATERRARALLRSRRAPRGEALRAEAALAVHLAAVRRAGELAFYERVLALWHAVHLPLCVLLFAAAAVHVVAVHLY